MYLHTCFSLTVSYEYVCRQSRTAVRETPFQVVIGNCCLLKTWVAYICVCGVWGEVSADVDGVCGVWGEVSADVDCVVCGVGKC